jgi:DNA invertase Pin-like site-specific DNA recombinase
LAILVAQYLRMSTEQQVYSLARQGAAIAEYAAARGYAVVRTYADEGLSGLQIRKRKGLQALLSDVMAGAAPYSRILVYDVSRWGRFQDPDESAHYEFLCRAAGIDVEYCAEAFNNDGSISAVLLKSLKRVMAAEFSRELSEKVSTSQARAASLGFWVNGPAGYGLRRQVIRHDAGPGRVLDHGEGKAMNERVKLTPGPPEEVQTVRRIYRLYVIGGLGVPEIAATLAAEGSRAEAGAAWTATRVRQVLSNEKYIGTLVTGRTKHFLGSSQRNQSATWRRLPGAFPALVEPAMFEAARRHLRKRWPKPRVSSEIMLANLAAVFAKTGRLSASVINAAPTLHCSETYKQRFGTLMDAYRLVGYAPSQRQLAAAKVIRGRHPRVYRDLPPSATDEEMLAGLARLYATRGDLSVNLIEADKSLPRAFRYRLRYGGMRCAYALVGFIPDLRRQMVLDHRGAQSITVAQACAIAARVPPGGYLLPEAVGFSASGTPMPER